MIDPRFANAGAIPLVPGFGAQQVPMQYHHHHHQHRHHHKNKGQNDASPVSRDESIHKVDHGQHHFLQNNEIPLGGGYGVPYGVTGFGAGGAPGFQQQQQYGAGNFGFPNQYTGVHFGQGPVGGGPVGQGIRQHRRHNRHHRHHTAEAVNTAAHGDQGQGAPEQLIGQRSSSAMNNERHQTRSPVPLVEGEVAGEQGGPRRRHRRHHRHHHGEHAIFGQAHQWRQTQGHTAVGSDGYGHINEDLIFIERGDHSPHRQEPPVGYEYKGKIEVQGIDREIRSRSHGPSTVLAPPVSISQSIAPPMPISQPIAPTSSFGPCPPGWKQVILTAAPGGPNPPGTVSYTGQTIGAIGGTQTGMSSFGPVGSFGVAGSGGVYGSSGTGVPFSSQCQLVADYIFAPSTTGVSTSGGSGFTSGYKKHTSTGIVEQFHGEKVTERVSGRPTIIEVWQRRAKSEKREKSRSRSRSRSRSHHRSRTPTTGPSFDFERFRSEILSAIERIVPRASSGSTEIQWTGRDGGTQTQIHPSTGGETRIEHEKRHETAGEVRVIVQPIQPVFYMPRQTSGTIKTEIAPQIGPIPSIQQPTTTSAPNVVYVPRNVYVPVIKPVFVPRERVIVRPQVIHVARPVLVDRPVPVTQRPIIIDRERPIPVPVRSGGQAEAQAGGSKVVREEYVYRDNLPVAYGGRCPEFAGGVNYGYMPTQQEHQYASSSTHEASNIFQRQPPIINVNVPNQYQRSHSASQFEGQPGICKTFHGSYTDLAGTGGSFTTGINNDYLAAQQGQQYAAGSTHEAGNIYQTEGSVVNINVPNQYQHSQSASHLELQQGGLGSGSGRSFHGSYTNLVGANAGLNVGQHNQDILRQTFEQTAQISGIPPHGPTQIEVLDTAVNPCWQKTDQSTLMRRYGRPAFEIVHKSEEVEQQMYHELRQRASTSGIVRSASTASYGSGSGIGLSGSGIGQY
ncbi:unnamed protein product [Rotaria sp. Silwood2]|nr:unnamed protein product [Rotaria sp. Silwood2]CAF2543219.1 unnamed protein product [Rotaria sp. Silwood2]CAF2779804.1 unnamed protein product [Rotaria sp. Silwood2]CAF2923523.1 unnamed protein product [Rotaria sp. Silwood2]CAF4008300.1 unnamed protein product [Rotaria sp. Silwood2]